ncbi:MAG: thiamine phosphate synthase [Candidatus Jettenia sp.]|uniref:Thiamine-phosphate synthase n=1 Tax=Candidatus Jettenia caeni TaxID=247490 RepID=I3IJV2_9BACT|nr:thiamine phosphate synthase [Candidatus Jettenia sp. AMX1]MBC6927790.1 thiamine phosphate synthase [Candidatus Jettenia sp.]WKZ17264.1 MAG: thiamine phosphate synthase [Candidatus Jettenia caeni]KAA0250297.1 MAG: thiamine phosphate synthase [Candidatus Jettenia sp. AMX1]MCE7879467.1 thiamine phosphate synthase [Candidatus Jettenia sp. AMX1]MCQ3926111.1 thiamine phosphate synthase [Candidatus Jettenia sp.]
MVRKESLSKLSFILITDRNFCKQSFLTTIKLALKGGIKTIQLREKGLTTYELYSLASELRTTTSDFKANLIINDRVDIALAVEADGVHLGWQSLPYNIVRKLFGFEKLIGVSTHTIQEALQAQENKADYITFGPVFTTPSKAGLLDAVGPDEIQKLKNKVHIPVVALGGIHEGNVEAVLDKGADGIAVISSIMHADNPENAARSLSHKIGIYKK